MGTPVISALARAGRSLIGGAALVLCVLAAGCGSGGQVTSAASHPATAAASAKPVVAASAPVLRQLRILSPAAGAHTGAAVTVRVRVSGGALHGARPLRYVLDGALGRMGTTRLTFRELAPGRHRLVVLLAGDPRVRASSSFTVLAPAPVAQPSSAEPMQTHPPEPQPVHTTAERTTTEHASPPPAPAREGSIPQGGAGDGDGDNSGAPSDGDGNV
jgi:hypothetical protein